MKTVIIILLEMLMASGTLYGQTEGQAPPIPSEEQPEVLTRGPVNEAFAQPVNIEEESNFTVTEAPPPDIEESPPEDRPDGDQFAWIPGYWAWDSERNEYIWVSGCWRAVPPGKYWVAGYWTEVEDGWRWVEGYWASVSEEEIEYLPPPPTVTYVVPEETEAPDMIWVPPCWYWNYGHYTLRSGYWIGAREDWVWIPSHYVWTPRGYVFVSGHWDYPLVRRGVLFAPVYFPGHIYWRTRYSYALSIVIDIGNLEFGLFTRPRYSHYYFGDYYDSFYIGIGIYPRYECVSRHSWYDPFYYHDRWRHRRYYPNWHRHERREYEHRRANKQLRPPRTYREMERRVRNEPESLRKKLELATTMNRHIEKNKTTFRFRKESPEERRQITRNSRSTKRYPNVRSIHESSGPVRREDRKTIEREKSDRKQSGQREYPNIRRTDSSETRLRDQEHTTRSNHPEKGSSVQGRAKIREKSNNTKDLNSRTIKKTIKKAYQKTTQSKSDDDEKGEEEKSHRRN